MSSPTAPLLQPVTAGALELPNRIWMAPMTRLRTLPDLSMRPIVETYYAQRASAGLIISEVVAVSPFGAGYGPMPEFITDAQIASWKKVVEAVHAAGGRIAAQLWHSGRERKAEEFVDDDGPFAAVRKMLLPAQLTSEELAAIPAAFAVAARKAMEIGFDAVEIHAGNAMLMANFLRGDANQRTDEFGGSAENRTRLLRNTVQAVTDAAGKGRVGLKLAPNGSFKGRFDSTARETFSYLLPELAAAGLAYLQVNRPSVEDLAACTGETIPLEWVREHYAGTLVGAPKVRAMQIIEELEPVDRGLYGGTIGYFGAQGDMDQAITIRTLVFEGDQYSYQAGAGVVADSHPESEFNEVFAKSAALRSALSMAGEGL